MKKVASSGTTVYIADLYEVENGVVTKHIFLGANRICTVDSGPSTVDYYFYHQDHLGSTNLITNDQGSQTQLVEYLPFGEINLLSGTDLTDYKFTGKELDQSTGLYYYGARYYNPALSHFTQADPLIQDTSDPQTLNHYAYCRNNPLIYVDPTGMQLVSLSSFISDYSYGSYSDYSSYGYDRYSSYYTSSYTTTLNSVASLSMLGMGAGLYEYGGQIGGGISDVWANRREERSLRGAGGAWEETYKLPPIVAVAGTALASAEPTPIGEILIGLAATATAGYGVYEASKHKHPVYGELTETIKIPKSIRQIRQENQQLPDPGDPFGRWLIYGKIIMDAIKRWFSH